MLPARKNGFDAVALFVLLRRFNLAHASLLGIIIALQIVFFYMAMVLTCGFLYFDADVLFVLFS